MVTNSAENAEALLARAQSLYAVPFTGSRATCFVLQEDDVDPEILALAPEEIESRIRMLDNEILVRMRVKLPPAPCPPARPAPRPLPSPCVHEREKLVSSMVLCVARAS